MPPPLTYPKHATDQHIFLKLRNAIWKMASINKEGMLTLTNKQLLPDSFAGKCEWPEL